MKKYDYKVDYISANVSVSDMNTGKAGAKIASQVQEKINGYMSQGYELYQQFHTNVMVSPGCLDGLGGAKTRYETIISTVFRKEIEA